MEQEFSVTNPEIQIKHIAGAISISQSSTATTFVSVDSAKADDVYVEQRGNRIVINQEQRRRLRKIIVSDVTINVRVPETATLEISSIAGSITVNGTFVAVTTKTVSGNVCGALSTHDIEAKTVAGDLDLTLTAPGQVTVKSVSGDIAVALAPGLGIDIDAKSLSGNLSSEIELNGNASNSALVFCKATSVSGDIRLQRAR